MKSKLLGMFFIFIGCGHAPILGSCNVAVNNVCVEFINTPPSSSKLSPSVVEFMCTKLFFGVYNPKDCDTKNLAFVCSMNKDDGAQIKYYMYDPAWDIKNAVRVCTNNSGTLTKD